MRKLIVYPNCSKGGVSSVIRGRARDEPNVEFDALFFNDKGGLNAFDDLENVTVRIIRSDRSTNYLTYLTSTVQYAEISVLSHPATANLLSVELGHSVTYEFHSSDLSVIEREINALEVFRIAKIVAPSGYMAGLIEGMLPESVKSRIEMRPNLVDRHCFSPDGRADFFDGSKFKADSSSIPLVWVGRFDLGKGYQFFVRTLAQLPNEFIGHVIVSIEDDPHRANRFLSECSELGVSDRVRLYLNLPQSRIASLFRSARDKGGMLVSTSLKESFGYSIAEAAACSLPIAAFDLPVLAMFEDSAQLVSVPTGSVQALAAAILESAGREKVV
ncbi:glycosyltransferase family 4 protein [Dietzia sp. MNB45]|uniref:glycosyltransferase family 4 protein n=1 Tax=Dietzia sp. MNB45 TaxID=3238800 RepID=UPI003F7D2AA7